eukprot:3319640-Alexandrium_andersonii.AAC.1
MHTCLTPFQDLDQDEKAAVTAGDVGRLARNFERSEGRQRSEQERQDLEIKDSMAHYPLLGK